MADAAKRRARYEDLHSVPENMVGEILNGELVVSPRPAAGHAIASSVLGGNLLPPFHRGKGGPGGWWIVDEPELHLHEDVLVPDIAGWRRERMPEYPAGVGVELAPDWVCEVLSPSTRRVDRVVKMPIYAREGVGHLWLIDPEAQTVEAFELSRERWSVVGVWGGNDVVRIPPFDAIELELAPLWDLGGAPG